MGTRRTPTKQCESHEAYVAQFYRLKEKMAMQKIAAGFQTVHRPVCTKKVHQVEKMLCQPANFCKRDMTQKP